MSTWTEKDIPIECGECPKDSPLYTGVDAMVAHILEAHKQYRQDEAIIYANLWMEDAFERSDAEDAEYSDQMREIRGIKNDYQTRVDRDIDFQKHKL